MCHCLNLYHLYNNSWNNNYSFVILICLFASHTYTLFCTQLHSRLIELQLTVVCFCTFISQKDRSNEGSWSRQFLFLPYREFYCDRLYMCALIHVFPQCLLFVVYLKGLRCICVVCIVFTISLILKVFVFIAFAYCFRMNDIRSFRVTCHPL